MFDLQDFFKVTFLRDKTDDNGLAIENDKVAIEITKVAIETDKAAIEIDKTAIESSDRISAIIKYLEQNGSGKNTDFTNLLGLSPQRIREILQEMIHDNLIEKHGDKRHTFYTLIKQ